MGACDFQHYAPGIDAKEAFNTASEEATYEHGHGGYSGTIAEKGSFVIITHTPLLEAEAYAMADKLMRDHDPRIDDKWGPAGAIPVVKDTRNVDVKDFEYIHDNEHYDYAVVQPALLEAVTPLVKLAKGEVIQRVDVRVYQQESSRNSYARVPAKRVKRTVSSAVVQVKKPPTTRIAPISFDIPGSEDYDARQKAIETTVRSMRLKAGESIVGWRVTGDTPGRAKVTAKAGGGPNEKRFIVKGAGQHDTWETGFASQAEARAWATKYMSADNRFHTDHGFVEIEAVTRRADGQALVRVTREVAKHLVEVEVEVKLANAQVKGNPDGWLFFGWSSC